jgi:hypothetical protein
MRHQTNAMGSAGYLFGSGSARLSRNRSQEMSN